MLPNFKKLDSQNYVPKDLGVVVDDEMHHEEESSDDEN
jgi:hypothetical protein